MKDGTILAEEYNATETHVAWTDKRLFERFRELTGGVLDPERQRALYDFAMTVDSQESLTPMLDILRTLPTVQ